MPVQVFAEGNRLPDFGIEGGAQIIRATIRDKKLHREQGTESFEVCENGTRSIIEVTEDENVRKVKVISEEETYELVLDKTVGELFSSKTGEKISVPSEAGNLYGALLNRYAPSAIEIARADTSHYDVYVSYAEIRSAIGDTTSIAGLAATIAARIPKIEVYADLVSKISSIVSGVATIFIPNDPNHGFRLSIREVKYHRRHMGQRLVYRTDHFIEGVSKY